MAGQWRSIGELKETDLVDRAICATECTKKNYTRHWGFLVSMPLLDIEPSGISEFLMTFPVAGFQVVRHNPILG